MRVNGDDNFRVFQKLMKMVAKKVDLGEDFENYGQHQFKKLSKAFIPPDSTISELSPTTLRDYRYMYIRKYAFKAETEKLSILTKYATNKDWEDFKNEYFPELENGYFSFFKSADIYEAINANKEGIRKLALQYENYRKQDPGNPQYHFDLAICLLYEGSFRQASKIFQSAFSNASMNALVHHFYALSLFEGKRPYRHAPFTINKIMDHLGQALTYEPERKDSLFLKRIVEKDFHARIGFSYMRSEAPILISSNKSLIEFTSKCLGISTNESINLTK